MFITTRNHLATIKEIRTYWSNQLDKANQEVRRLKAENAFLRASLRVARAPEPLPAPLPAAREPELVVVHLPSDDPRKTLCKENVYTMNKPGSTVRHLVGSTSRREMLPAESWCADCLG